MNLTATDKELSDLLDFTAVSSRILSYNLLFVLVFLKRFN